MKKFLIAWLVLLAGVQSIYAQHIIQGEKGSMTRAATVRVSEMSPLEPADSPQFKVPNKNWAPPQWDLNEEDIIYVEPEGLRDQATRSVTEISPAPDTSFHGLEDNGNSIPPDVNGAAGPDHLMITLNTQVRIQDRTGNNLFTTYLGTFWSSMPNDGGTFDPKIIYDPYANRWIMVTPSSSAIPESKVYIGVSATSDPLGEWYMYWFDPDPDNQTWFDYPSMGFNKKWITISGNMFGNGFYRTVFVIDKEAAYSGADDPTVTRFATTEGFTLVPSVTYDTVAEDMYLICTSNGNQGGNGFIKKFKVSGEVSNPVFEYEGAIGVPEPWANGAGQNGNFLPQLGSPELINSVDSRMETVIYRNNKIWAVHHIFLPVDNPQRTAVQWWELDTNGTILQRGRIDDPDNVYSFAFPSIAVNPNEDILIGHNVFSATQYAGAGYSFKAYYDDANTMRTYYQYKDGENPYNKSFGSGRNRWGDYSATCVDPVNGYDFWALQEYAASPENNWGTWWAFLKPTFEPVAAFTSNEVLIPTGETVDFTDLTQGVPASWEWTFEGGTPATSNQQNPEGILFSQEGSFDVTLIASNALGFDTLVMEDYITTSSTLLPAIAFSVDKPSVCVGEAADFEDKSANSPTQWDWQFNPSTVSFVNETDQTSQNPTVVFEEAGIYSLNLTVWNLNGSSDTIVYDVMVAGGYTPYFRETFETTQLSLKSWSVENPDNDITWDLFEVGGTGPGTTAAGIDFANYFKIGERDRLISPSFNLSNLSGAALEFRHAYAKRLEQISDSLIIYVSGDCGENWTRVLAIGEDGSGNFATHELTDSFWPENVWDWCGFGTPCISVDLSPWAGQTDVRVAFESWSAYGNPLFIDNVQLSQYVGEDENNPASGGVAIYPNPSNGTFNVRLNGDKTYTDLSISNMMGQSVSNVKIDNNQRLLEISLEGGISPGIYFVEISGPQQRISKKIIVY